MSKASKKKEARKDRRKEAQKTRQTAFLVIGVIIAIVVISAVAISIAVKHSSSTTSSQTTYSIPSNKPIILYVNQGNALVDRSNFSELLTYAKSQHFNTIFFQIYRSGQLLFNQTDLSYFTESAHLKNLTIYFALYFTSPTQQIPSSIYNSGEDGINLDMSILPFSNQNNLLATLKQNYNGKTAVTSTNLTTTLSPNLLILETYNFQADEQYIHSGIIASIEPLVINSSQQYQQQFQYAVTNSDGVMVFDYYGLLKTRY